ncbi:hypothetical protein GCM10017567_82400 [Amycolatopsis bullii]|uniref:Uncharacterized protein n=1 Tax=Amycolatopsis bullii TaxID=941987 RepID=A0ABQ3KTV0_9PSEU|nr:hypothetical protein GCM10017567_82400 [Amycolatopsis bullii]
MQLLGPLADAAGVFFTQQGGQQLAGTLADRAVHAPRVDVPVQRVERPAPGVDVEVVGVDEGAVDVEQDRGGDGWLLGSVRVSRCPARVSGGVLRIPRREGTYT